MEQKKPKTLLINSELIYSHLFDTNPFLLDQHEKKVTKFVSTLKSFNKVIVFFEGIVRDHDLLLRKKNLLLQEHLKKKVANNKKLNNIATPILASLLLEKQGVKVLFSYESDLMNTIYQYALNESNTDSEVTIVCKYSQNKLDKANEKFKNITFANIVNVIDNELKLSTSISKDENSKKAKYYNQKTETERILVDEATVEYWNREVIQSKELPKCLNTYLEVRQEQIKDQRSTVIFASGSFNLEELGNPYVTLTKHRQAVYHKLKIESVVEEIMVCNEATKEYAFLPYIVKADEAKSKELSFIPDKLFKLIFHSLDKTSSVLFTEYNNHVCSAFAELLVLLSLISEKASYLELFKKYADKVKPIEKVIIDKKCNTCNRNFKMKESQLEIYKIRELPYPSNCQDCIDEKAREKKNKEEFEKQIAEQHAREEAKKKEEEEKNENEKEKENAKK